MPPLSELHFTTDIHCPVEAVFGLIADLSHYSRWLSSSNLYAEMAFVSDDPIKLGTTYVDQGQSSIMKGSITVFEPPTRIRFEQHTQIKLMGLDGGLDIQTDYTLANAGGITHLRRDVVFTTQGILKLAQPILTRSIRKENERILQKMKTYLEATQAD
jgi:uncharacterized protein YndB with AHSA1/START domain